MCRWDGVLWIFKHQEDVLIKNIVHHLLRQADKIGVLLVNIAEHSAAKESDVSFRSWQRPESQMELNLLGGHCE